MDKNIENAINNFVWFIPIKKIRNSVREILFYIVNKNYNIEKKLSCFIDHYNTIDNKKAECVIIKMAGGFTDQLLTYVIGKYINTEYDIKVKYDNSWYKDYGMDNIGKNSRNFELTNVFPNIPFEIATEEEINIFSSLFNFTLFPLNINELNSLLYKKRYIYLTSRYMEISVYLKYKELFDNIFDFDKYLFPKLDAKNIDIYQKITSCSCPVAIHIRLGDLSNEFKSIDNNYFMNAMNTIVSEAGQLKPKFFIFSNDMDYVKNNIFKKDFSNFDYEFVDGNDNDKGYIDFYLMSKCNHIIASLSRFAFGAYNFIKNNNKIFILPKNNAYGIIDDFNNSNFYEVNESNDKFIIKPK